MGCRVNLDHQEGLDRLDQWDLTDHQVKHEGVKLHYKQGSWQMFVFSFI